MPRYHFNVYDGATLLDREGTELPDWEAARLEAIRYSGDIFKNDTKRIAFGEDWRMEVTDDNGLVLFRLDFCVHATAATLNMRPTFDGKPHLH